MNFSKYHSVLDTDRFGFNIAKINSFNEPLSLIINELQSKNYKLILSKVKASDIELINELEQNGFVLKDIQTTYKFELNDDLHHVSNDAVKVRDAEDKDKDKLYDIAINSFNNYGHYAADHKLDSQKCRDIYGDWILRSFDKNVADNILVAECDGEISGFLTHKIYTDVARYAAGGIGAVDLKYRSKNVFKAITVAGLKWAQENNCEWVEHNVLITNYPVNRSFCKLGFKPSNSFITFHKWL